MGMDLNAFSRRADVVKLANLAGPEPKNAPSRTRHRPLGFPGHEQSEMKPG
jgi:hypothetical protein